mgnify:CR=1 FL=1
MSPDQKGIETELRHPDLYHAQFTMSPDQKGIETHRRAGVGAPECSQ